MTSQVALIAARKQNVRQTSRKNCKSNVCPLIAQKQCMPLDCQDLTLTHEEIVRLSSRRQRGMGTPSDGVVLVESVERVCNCNFDRAWTANK